MRESAIERDCLVRAVAAGGFMLKWVSPGNSGVPDRILFLPGCPVVFVELKQPGQPLERLQEYWARTLRGMGQEVWSISDADDFQKRTVQWREKHATPV